MKLSDLVGSFWTDDQLSELFPPNNSRGRPRINSRDLQVIFLWLKGYSAVAIARDIQITLEAVSRVVRCTLYRLERAGVEMDMVRSPLFRRADPLYSDDDDVKRAIYMLIYQEQARQAKRHQHDLAVYILQSSVHKETLCRELQNLNLCASNGLAPSKKKDVCTKCIIKNSNCLVSAGQTGLKKKNVLPVLTDSTSV